MEPGERGPGPAVARPRRVGMERCLICLTLVLFSSSLGLVLALTQVVGDVELDRPQRQPPLPPASNSSITAVNNTSTAADNASSTAAANDPSTAAANDSSTATAGRSPREVPTGQGDLCVTADCVEMASQLLQYRQPAADPCRDFHQFACGGWQQEARLLGLSSHHSSFSINADYMEAKVDRKIQKLLEATPSEVEGIAWAQYFYQHCVNEVHGNQLDLDTAADYILQEVLGGLLTGRPPDLTSTLLRLRLLTADALLDVSLLPELSGGQRPALAIQLPSFDSDGSWAHRGLQRRRAHSWTHHETQRRTHRQSQERHSPRPAQVAKGGGKRRPKPRRVSPLAGVTPPETTGWDGAWPAQDGASGHDDYGQLDAAWSEYTDGEGDDEGGFYHDVEDAEEGGGSEAPLRNASQLYEESRNDTLSDNLEEISNYFIESIIAQGLFPEDISEEELESMLDFMQEFHSIMPSPRERAISDTRFHLRPVVTVAQLQRQYPYIDWKRYLSGVLQTTVRRSDPVYVLFPRYMRQLGDLLDRHDPRVVYNTLLLRFRTEFLANTAGSLVEADTSLPAGRQFCASLAKEVFPVAMSAMFIRDVGRQKVDQLRQKVSSILDEIRGELLRSIEQKMAEGDGPLTSPDPLLLAARSKIQSTRYFLLAPENQWDDRYVDANTPPVTTLWRRSQQSVRVLVRPGRKMLLDLLKGLRRAEVIAFKSELRDLSSSDLSRWPPEVEPLTANAFHLVTRNAVGIPLALLTEPYFYEHVPEYVQFAVLGVTLAHELMHGIDNTGFHFDETGAVLQLSDDFQRRVAEKFRCVRTDYVQALSKVVDINDEPVDLQLDGDLTLSENAADYSSLALSLAAYSRRRERLGPEPGLPGVNLTSQQTFLTAFAQVYCADIDPESYVSMVAADIHPPNPERVNGVVRHTPEFAAAFNCPAGAPMSPNIRCDPVW